MPLLRRADPDPAVASARVRRLLDGAVVQGWVPPPLVEEWPPGGAGVAADAGLDLVPGDAVEADAGLDETAVPDDSGWRDDAAAPYDAGQADDPAGIDVGKQPAEPVVGVLDRLRSARLDPGRRGAAGLALVGVLAAVVACVVLLRGRPEQLSPPAVDRVGTAVAGAAAGSAAVAGAAAGSAAPAPGTQVVVAVAGHVRRPGVVRLPAGSRVEDAVRAAGGVSPGASPGLLNLARLLVDGEQVLVGLDPTGAPVAAPGTAVAGGPVDLNTADAAALDDLPGIGPVLAQRIVEWRTENGRFASVDQLREVPGIGEAKYSQLRSKVRV